MAIVTHTCTHCGKPMSVPDRYQGRDLRCPQCGQPFRVEPSTAPGRDPREAAPVPPSRASTSTPGPAPAAQPPRPGVVAPTPTPADAEPGATEPHFDLISTAPVFWRVKQIGVLSAAMTACVLHGIAGLLLGIAIAFLSLLPSSGMLPLMRSWLLGGAAILVLPVAFGVAGFLTGAVGAALYNLTARMTGGLDLLLE